MSTRRARGSRITAFMLALCGGGLAEGAAAAAATPLRIVESGLRIDVREDGQPISARNLNELVVALSGDNAHARTRVDYEHEVELSPETPAGCTLVRAEVRIDIEVILPVWAGAPPGRAVSTNFERVAGALRDHEYGHVALVIEEARRTRDGIAAAGRFVDCRAARRFVLREQLQFERRLRWRNEQYDRATARGARQGAVIQRPRGPRR